MVLAKHHMAVPVSSAGAQFSLVNKLVCIHSCIYMKRGVGPDITLIVFYNTIFIISKNMQIYSTIIFGAVAEGEIFWCGKLNNTKIAWIVVEAVKTRV